MKIAITGATGFIGKHLVFRHLQLGDEVQILTRKPGGKNIFPKEVKIFNGDLSTPNKVLDYFADQVDILYHCAAEIREEAKMFQVNVQGTSHLIQAAKGKVKHWVQLSSTGCYGLNYGTVNETTVENPQNEYERSKVESDKLIKQAGMANFFSFAILRPSNVFGPDMKNQSLFQLVKAVEKGLFFFIGPRGANANYIPVENVVKALVLVGTDARAKGNVFNVSDSLTMENFIELIANKLGKPLPALRLPLHFMKTLASIGDFIPKSPLTSGRVEALSNKVYYDNSLIETELRYCPVLSLKDGMENFVDFYLKHKI